MGRDPVGDVQVVASGARIAPADPLVVVDRDFSEVRFHDLLTDADIVDPVVLPGVQDKVSTCVLSLPLGRAGSSYLLKLDVSEFPYMVANEAYFLDLAKQCRVPAAVAHVVRDADDRPGLLVRRFDRLPSPGGGRRALACEDACQVLDRWPGDKYNVTAEAALTALAAVCASSATALRSGFQQLCFARLTGNGDVHAKNLSVLAAPSGRAADLTGVRPPLHRAVRRLDSRPVHG